MSLRMLDLAVEELPRDHFLRRPPVLQMAKDLIRGDGSNLPPGKKWLASIICDVSSGAFVAQPC